MGMNTKIPMTTNHPKNNPNTSPSLPSPHGIVPWFPHAKALFLLPLHAHGPLPPTENAWCYALTDVSSSRVASCTGIPSSYAPSIPDAQAHEDPATPQTPLGIQKGCTGKSHPCSCRYPPTPVPSVYRCLHSLRCRRHLFSDDNEAPCNRLAVSDCRELWYKGVRCPSLSHHPPYPMDLEKESS